MSQRRLAVHYFIRTGLFAFFAFYILRLVKTDKLILYIGPKMQLYVKLASIGFYILAVLQLYLAFQTWWGNRPAAPDCDCGNCAPDQTTRSSRAFAYGLFAIPLLLFLLLPDQALNSRLAEMKGVTLTGSINTAAAAPASGQANRVPEAAASSSKDALAAPSPSPAAGAAAPPPGVPASGDELDALFPHDEYSEDLATLGKKLYKQETISIADDGFMEVVSSIDFYMSNFIGKQVDMVGFIYREADMKPEQFVASRFAVQCCSADSAPFGFMVESPLGKNLKQDTWVKVTGKLDTTTYNGNEILKINATKVELVKAPASPYVFPNMDYFKK